jgi:hypothetical protein
LQPEGCGAQVIIYKTPKGYDLISWIAVELERERRKIQEQCAAIDAKREYEQQAIQTACANIDTIAETPPLRA